MTIDLKPEQQRVIDMALESGANQNTDEVLDRAFEIIRDQLDIDDWLFAERAAIAAHVGEGFAQAERGELVDPEVAVEMLRLQRSEQLKRHG
jgi:hypothetical protein